MRKYLIIAVVPLLALVSCLNNRTKAGADTTQQDTTLFFNNDEQRGECKANISSSESEGVAVDSVAQLPLNPLEAKTESEKQWKEWFESHREQSYIYLHGMVSPDHETAINDLLALCYDKDKSLRNNTQMIQWRLNQFHPIEKTNNRLVENENIEQQIESLLDFNVDMTGYTVRRKSALTVLMFNFLVKTYEDKVRSTIQDNETKALFDKDVLYWQKFHETTLDTFEKLVLGKELYALKVVFWNNYDIDVMDNRYVSLRSLYLNHPDYPHYYLPYDYSYGRTPEMDIEYADLREKIPQKTDSEYEYSYKKKMDAIDADEEAFFEFLMIHAGLLEKLNKDDNVRWDGSRMMMVRGMFENYNTGLYMGRFKGSIGKSLW
ncbi:MAG: hypothetical protein IKV83_09490 [Muribaculaceae bacterium]|nr:hypothetical protein [Muribaculaceae bacterium]